MNKLNTALLAGAVAGLVAGVSLPKDAAANKHEAKGAKKAEKHHCKDSAHCDGKHDKKKKAEAAHDDHGHEGHEEDHE